MSDDASLLHRYAGERDQEAFAELVRRHLDGVYSAALRRVGGDTHRAEDVAQQVFVAMARKAGSLIGHPALSAWLYTTTRHEAANVVRTERRRRAREEEAIAMQDPAEQPAPEPNWSHVAPVLDEAIDRLNEVDRCAVLLRFVDQRSFAEVGAALKLTDAAARMRVERALDKLRTMFAQRGIVSSSAALGAALTNHAVTAAPVGLAAGVVTSALATTGSAVAPLPAILQIMSTSKIAAGFIGAILIFSGSLAVREVSAGREASATLSLASQEMAARQAMLTSLMNRADRFEQEGASLQQNLAAARADRAAADQRAAQRIANDAASAPDPVAAGHALMEAHPEVRRTFTERSRARIMGHFSPLFKELGLNSVQIEQLRELLILGEGAKVSSRDHPPMVISVSPDGVPADRDEKIKAIIGEAGFHHYQAYMSTVGGRMLAQQLASSLALTPTPLSAEQGAQMSRLFAESRKESTPWGNRTDWEAVLANAATILTEQQLAPLRGYRDQEEYHLAHNEAIRRGNTLPVRRQAPANAPKQ